MSNWVTSRAAPEAIRVLSTLPRGAQDRILASTPRSKYPIQGIQLAPCCSLSSPYGPVATRCCAPVLRGGLLYGWVLEVARSEEHTSELQSHSFISYAVFCLKKTT